MASISSGEGSGRWAERPLGSPTRAVKSPMMRTTWWPCLLELAQLLEHDRVAEVDVGRGRVDAELDPQRPAGGELLLEPPRRQHVDRVARQVRHGAMLDCRLRSAARAPAALDNLLDWRRSSGKRSKPRLKKLRFLFVLLGLGVLALVSMVFGMMAAVSQDLPAIYNFAQYKASKNSEVFDASGEPIGTLTSDQNKILLTSGQISPNIKNAVVSIEDSRFYEHNGVDFQGIGRALIKDILSQSAAQGASTITEQFVKNALEAEGSRTVFEKFREAALAYRLERHWSKDKILTEYLNTIYFGEGAYGIEAAARTYFGKAHPGCGTPTEPCASVLEPWEAATLAGDHRLALGLRPEGLPRKLADAAQPGAGKDVRTGLHHPGAVRGRHASRPCPRRTTSSRPSSTRRRPTSPPGCASSWSTATAPRRPSSAA